MTALQNRRTAEAREELAQAERLNPKQAGLWIGYANLGWAEQKPDREVEALKKELGNHPEETGVYRILAQVQAQNGHAEEALDAWLALLKADPKDTDAARQLWPLLAAKKRYADAVEPLQAALKALPDDQPVEAMLGEALIRAGKKDEGLTVLQKIGSHTSNTGGLHRAALALADSGADLPLAREYAERSVRALEDESKKVALASLTDLDLERVTNLDAAWDALGWVHFHLNDLPKAAMFVRAAWVLGQTPDVGGHLGEIYERQGNADAAVRVYQMILDVKPGADDIRGRLQKIQAPEGTFAPSPEDLPKLRTTAVPSLSKKTGSAEFFVLFSPGKIEDAQFISGADSLKEARDALMKARFDVPFPDGSSAKIVRRGILSCSSYTTPNCQFTFIPTADTKK